MRALRWIGLGVLAAAVIGAAASGSYLPWAKNLPWRDDVLAWVQRLPWTDRLPWPGSVAQLEATPPVEIRPPQRRAVAALGRIEPHTEVIDLGASAPGLVEELLVQEGQFVSKGERLAYLDSYRERIAERDEQAARLSEARALLDAEIALGQAQIGAAEVHVHQIEKVYPLRVEGQRARIRLLSAELANNREILDDRLTLQKRAASSRRTVDDQRTVVRMNEQELEMARAELAQLQAEHETELLAATAALQREKAALRRAQVAIGVASTEKDLALAEARVARSVVRAPMAGQILKVVTWPGERVSEAPILQMGDSRIMHAVAEVYESDIGLVRIGQPALIRSASLPDDLTGRVVQIGQLIFKNDVLNVDPAADTDARVVEVRIELDDGERVQRLTNMTVDVVIDVEGTGRVAGLGPPTRP